MQTGKRSAKAKMDKLRALLIGTASIGDFLPLAKVRGMWFTGGDSSTDESKPSWYDHDPLSGDDYSELAEQQQFIKANPSLHATPPLTRKERRKLAKAEKEQANLAPVLPLECEQPKQRPFATITAEYGFTTCPSEYDNVRRELGFTINNLMR